MDALWSSGTVTKRHCSDPSLFVHVIMLVFYSKDVHVTDPTKLPVELSSFPHLTFAVSPQSLVC
jgi:hypothetical protein